MHFLILIGLINISKIELHDLIKHCFDPISEMYEELGQYDLIRQVVYLALSKITLVYAYMHIYCCVYIRIYIPKCAHVYVLDYVHDAY